MNIIITGGCGFIGSALVRHLLNKTDHRIINIDKLTYAGNIDSIPFANNNPRYIFHKIDICDERGIEECFDRYQPDLVMHLAAESHVDRSISGPKDFIRTNILGTFNLLEKSRIYFDALDQIKKKNFKFHHISTDEVFGDLPDTNFLFTEETPYSPSSPYSASKAGSDHLVRSWGRTYGLPIVISNCSNNYGPYHFPEKLIPRIILNAINGKPLPIYGDGSQIRDWLYVEDHVKALFLVATQGNIGETYNIGGHNEKTNLEVVNAICSCLEDLGVQKPSNITKFTELIQFVKDRPGHDVRYAIDASKIKRDLGWIPKESFETGILKTVKWYLENNLWWEKILTEEYNHEKEGGKDD